MYLVTRYKRYGVCHISACMLLLRSILRNERRRREIFTIFL